MSSLKIILFRVCFCCLNIVYSFLKMLPTQKKYLFISKLDETPPADFLVLANALRIEHPDYKIVILCRTMKNKFRYVFHFFTQMYHLATSEVVFLERSCLAVHVLRHKKDLKVVQLWHALGSMKKFGYAILDTEEGQPGDLARVCHMHENYTYILISSKAFIQDYIEGFRTDGSNVVEIPLPHVDNLLDEDYKTAKRKEILTALPQLSEKKNIVYCPTFRKTPAGYTRQKIEELIECIDFERFNFVYQPHPLSKVEISDSRVVRSGFSTQDMLLVADAVISDYSSVIYEAGLLDLPVYLYAYDWSEYKKNRMHNIDIKHEIPVLFSEDPKPLIDVLQSDQFDYNAFRIFIENNVRVPERGTCCDAIIDLIDGCFD